MHEIKQVYQKQIKIAFALAFVFHLGIILVAFNPSILRPQQRAIPIRLVPYTELVAIKAPEADDPGSAPPPPVEQPPEEAAPPEAMSEVIPVPDWMELDSLMADVSPAPEHPVQEAVREVAGVGGGGRGAAGAGGDGGTSEAGISGADLRVDELPRLVKKVEPEYPRLARMSGVEGVVVLSLLVDESGHVTDTKVLKSLGNTGCDQAAVTAARQWRFTPAKKNGKSVAIWMSAPVLFQLKVGR